MKHLYLLRQSVLVIVLAVGDSSHFGWAEEPLSSSLSSPSDQPTIEGKEAAVVPEAPKDMPQVPELPSVREEIKLMQQIEPGFMPKDDRAIQLFMLQKVVADTEASIKSKSEQGKRIRELFSQKFREDLNKFTDTKIEGFNERIERSTHELIKYYELALRHNPHHPQLASDALYYLGFYYFEVD